jgi:hypothetical protein
MKPVQISDRPPIGAPSIPTCIAQPAKDYLNGGRFGGGAWLAFQVKRKLLPEEEIPGLQGSPSAYSETYELEGVLGKLEKHQNDV